MSQKALRTCDRPLGRMTGICEAKHTTARVLRCRKCLGCQNHRLSVIRAQANSRVKENKLQDTEVILWTLGTNWDYTPENYKELRRLWNLFNMRIHEAIPGFTNYFRVFEMGSKGGKLHIHFVSDTKFDYKLFNQEFFRKHWSDLTGIDNPNVHFRRVKYCSACKSKQNYYLVHRGKIVGVRNKCANCGNYKLKTPKIKVALAYIIKYLAKENQGLLTHNYYWGNSLKWKYVEATAQDYLQHGLDNQDFTYNPGSSQKFAINGRKLSRNPLYRWKLEIWYHYTIQNTIHQGHSIRYFNDIPLQCHHSLQEAERGQLGDHAERQQHCLQKILIKALEYTNYEEAFKVSKQYPDFLTATEIMELKTSIRVNTNATTIL